MNQQNRQMRMNQQNRQMQRQDTPKALVQQRMNFMLKALPSDQQDRFKQAAIGIANSPGVYDCTPESVFKTLFACARLNLIPDPVLHHAAVVPFRNKGKREATLVIEYRGLIELARRADPSIKIKAGTVYENDSYKLIEGTTDKLEVTERWWEKGADEPGPPKFFYCVSKQANAVEPLTVIIPAQEARKIGQNSKAGMKPGTPWNDHFERMGEKTAVRRSSRFWQLDPDKTATRKLQQAVELDERTDEQPDEPDPTQVFGEDFGAEGQGEPDDIPEGESRIGDVAQQQAAGMGKQAGQQQHSARGASGQSVEDASGAEAPASNTSAPQQPDPAGPATPEVKKQLGMRVDLLLDRAGIEKTELNRYTLLQLITGEENVAAVTGTASQGQYQQWQQAARSLSVEQINQHFELAQEPEPDDDGPAAQATEEQRGVLREGEPTPFGRIVKAWADARALDAGAAGAADDAARRLLRLKFNTSPSDVDEETAEALVAQISEGSVKFELYESAD